MPRAVNLGNLGNFGNLGNVHCLDLWQNLPAGRVPSTGARRPALQAVLNDKTSQVQR
jgi:hypothetical protein